MNTKIFFIFLIIHIIFATTLHSQVTDYDGNIYKTVKIENQTWMAENLHVTSYQNGDTIPHVEDPIKWKDLLTGAWCYYENESKNGIVYGKLYNWFAVNDIRGIAPNGWHIPTEDEWLALTIELGGDEIAGEKMKSKKGWNNEGNGKNQSGFNGLPAGFRYSGGDYANVGNVCNWWSAQETGIYAAGYFGLFYAYSDIGTASNDKKGGLSIRCLKD